MPRSPLFRPAEPSAAVSEPVVRPLADLHETNNQYTAAHVLLPAGTSVALSCDGQLGGYVAAGQVEVSAREDGPLSVGVAAFFQVCQAGSVEVCNTSDQPAAIVTFASPGTAPSPQGNSLRTVEAAEGDCVAVVGDVYRFLATAETSGGAFAIWEARVFPGGGPPPHVHSREEEAFYLLSGELQFTADGQTISATAGSFASMPVGVEHAFRNNTDRTAIMLIAVAPGGMEQMFARTGTVLPAMIAAPLPPSAEEKQRLVRIAPEYGIEIRLPGH
ncbi:MAG: cupin domain-containing protein [Planctomycetaceae bacterium]|nr:cupin domain-containing protein [Planctomycetaceae bacterium]